MTIGCAAIKKKIPEIKSKKNTSVRRLFVMGKDLTQEHLGVVPLKKIIIQNKQQRSNTKKNINWIKNQIEAIGREEGKILSAAELKCLL